MVSIPKTGTDSITQIYKSLYSISDIGIGVKNIRMQPGSQSVQAVKKAYGLIKIYKFSGLNYPSIFSI